MSEAVLDDGLLLEDEEVDGSDVGDLLIILASIVLVLLLIALVLWSFGWLDRLMSIRD
jgi:DMSO/TMAO reductase YedYZ heme-binding membrane subunit